MVGLNQPFQWYMRKRYRSLIDQQKQPVKAQEQVYRQLPMYDRNMTLKKFLKDSPVTSYDDYLTPFAAQMDSGKIPFIGLSSGTTGALSKRIPLNSSMAKLFSDFQMDVGSVLAQENGIQLLRDQRLIWGTTSNVETTEQGTPCGFISGYLSSQAPPITAKTRFPARELNIINDFSEKAKAFSKQAPKLNIVYAGGVPSYLIHLFQELKTELGVQNVGEIWPNLKTIVYSATPIEPHRNELRRLLGHDFSSLGTYMATEGAFGLEIPSLKGDIEGTAYSPHLRGLILSFLDPNTGVIKTIDEVEPGEELELLVTAPNGMINYRIGDVVEIVRTHPTVLFRVSGRAGMALNLGSEKTSMAQLNAVISRAKELIGDQLAHAVLVPSLNRANKAIYQWHLFGDESLASAGLNELFDSLMAEENEDYGVTQKELGLIGPAEVVIHSSDIIKELFLRKAGRGQLKLKSVFPSYSDFADEFLKQSEMMTERAISFS